MLLKAILNRVEKHKGFGLEIPRFGKDEDGVERIEIFDCPRKKSKGFCLGCDTSSSTYDHLPKGCFDFVPLWGIAVVLLYSMRRIDCPRCGVRVERIPFATGKLPFSCSFALYLADWAKSLSWQETARRFHVNWH